MFITTLLTISLPTKKQACKSWHNSSRWLLQSWFGSLGLMTWYWKKNRKNSLQKSRKSWILVQRTLKPVSCVTFTVSWISPDDASLPPHLQSMGYLCYVDTFGKRTSSILLDKVGKAIKITMLWNTSKHSPQVSPTHKFSLIHSKKPEVTGFYTLRDSELFRMAKKF